VSRQNNTLHTGFQPGALITGRWRPPIPPNDLVIHHFRETQFPSAACRQSKRARPLRLSRILNRWGTMKREMSPGAYLTLPDADATLRNPNKDRLI
jgi:hypothetical protein